MDNGWLYVSETFSQLISRFPLKADGTLGEREIFAQFPKGAFVDGISLDSEGGVWAACIVSNELFSVVEGQSPQVFISERNQNWVDQVEKSLDNKVMDRSHFDTSPARFLRNIASVAFHGKALDKIVCGCLLGDHLVSMAAPVIGKPPIHWNVEVETWGAAIC